MMLSVKPAGMMIAADGFILIHLLAGGGRIVGKRRVDQVARSFDWKSVNQCVAQLPAVLVDQNDRDMAKCRC